MERIEFISKSPSETWDIGEHIGRHARAGDHFAVYAELGAGKTQLVKGIARGLGIRDWQYVVSPSFTLVNVYEGDELELCHVDLYRIDGDAVDDLFLEEYLERGIIVVEWAERTTWRNHVIRVFIDVIEEETRKIVMEVDDAGRAKVWRNFSQRP